MTAAAPVLGSLRRKLMATAALAFAVDLAAKLAAVALLDGTAVRLGPVLTIRVVANPGVAFGLGADAPGWMLLAPTGAVVAVLGVLAWRGRIAGAVASGLILGGAIANVADRAIGGSVIDVIDLGWWPTFNLADTFIVIGVGLLILSAGAEAKTERARHADVEARPEGGTR